MLGINIFFRNHEEKKHACSYCGQKFLYLKDKRTHERTHTGERPFVCQVCGKAFNQKCTLDNHLISHNKTYVCFYLIYLHVAKNPKIQCIIHIYVYIVCTLTLFREKLNFLNYIPSFSLSYLKELEHTFFI